MVLNDKDYLSKNLIAFCSDGASTMMGRKSGVSAKLIEEFLNIIWHCLNHRLQLALDSGVVRGWGEGGEPPQATLVLGAAFSLKKIKNYYCITCILQDSCCSCLNLAPFKR